MLCDWDDYECLCDEYNWGCYDDDYYLYSFACDYYDDDCWCEVYGFCWENYDEEFKLSAAHVNSEYCDDYGYCYDFLCDWYDLECWCDEYDLCDYEEEWKTQGAIVKAQYGDYNCDWDDDQCWCDNYDICTVCEWDDDECWCEEYGFCWDDYDWDLACDFYDDDCWCEEYGMCYDCDWDDYDCLCEYYDICYEEKETDAYVQTPYFVAEDDQGDNEDTQAYLDILGSFVKRADNLKLMSTPETVTESSNWSYYAFGGVAIAGGLYFLTKNNKDQNRDVDAFLLH